MTSAIVGYTGFVGSNLCSSHQFDFLYNSKNIAESFGSEPDLLVYAGVPAEMYIANSEPEKDFKIIGQAIDHIRKIKAKRVVLISSVAVYSDTVEVDEHTAINPDLLLPYGRNRLYLEHWVRENCDNSLVVRLPAIYGINLKKNFIYDFINYFPAKLDSQKYGEFSHKETIIKDFYRLESDGFYKISTENKRKKSIEDLRQAFERLNFSALNFTDSRSVYQFYNLEELWNDICIALKHNIRLINLVTEPIAISDLYQELTGDEFKNYLPKVPFHYSVRTKYYELFGGFNGYIKTRAEEVSALREFIRKELEKRWDSN